MAASEIRDAAQIELHPELDLALLRLEQPLSKRVVPLGLASLGLVEGWQGNLVQLAGYGTPDGNEQRHLGFVAEPLVEVETDTLVVDGMGVTGGCEGDSGGPLLLRGDQGQPVVSGVLSRGAASCSGRDFYARVDAIDEWVSSLAIPPAAPSLDCGSLGPKGQCFPHLALRCAEHVLAATSCIGATTCRVEAGTASPACGAE